MNYDPDEPQPTKAQLRAELFVADIPFLVVGLSVNLLAFYFLRFVPVEQVYIWQYLRFFVAVAVAIQPMLMWFYVSTAISPLVLSLIAVVIWFTI